MSKKPATSRLAASILDQTLKGMSEAADLAEEPAQESPTRSVLAAREEDIRAAKKSTRERILRLRVDPDSCRMWEYHNRHYALLNEVRCQDLIEGFRAMEQQFPAIVRAVEGDPEHDWEVVCGARRHWTAAYLGVPFLIEVRELSDEAAFRLSDIENRDRQDISEYERALDYKQALALYYGGNQAQMAQRIEVSGSWLSRFLDLAELPDDIIKAYRSVTEIRAAHAKTLKPLLGSPTNRKRILETAREFHADPQEGRKLIAALKAATKGSAKKAAPQRLYASATERPMLSVTAKSNGGLVLEVFKDSGATRAELLEAFERSIEGLFS